MIAPPRIAAVPPHGGLFPALRNFDQVAEASPAGGATQVLVSFKIRPRTSGVLLWFGQSVLDTDAWASITWRIRVNGGIQENLSWTTRVGHIDRPTDVYVPLQPNETVDVEVTNGALGAFTIAARIKGFFWPTELCGLGLPAELGGTRPQGAM